jgi:hypothetical protein
VSDLTYHLHETTPGILNVESGQKLKGLLGENADQLLKQYGDRTPQSVEATFTDGDRHVYKGTLYLVTEEKQS